MKYTKTLCLSTWMIVVVSCSVSAQYYYSDGVQNPLMIDSLKVSVKFDDSASRANLVNAIDRIVSELVDKEIPDGFAACSLYTGDGYDKFLDSLDTIVGIYLAEPYYLSPSGFPASANDALFD